MIYHSRAAYRYMGNKITAKTNGLSRGAAPGDSHFMGQTAGVGDGIRLFAEEDQGWTRRDKLIEPAMPSDVPRLATKDGDETQRGPTMGSRHVRWCQDKTMWACRGMENSVKLPDEYDARSS